MKSILSVLIIGLFTVPALACPNFSGQFVGSSYFTVQQTGCSNLNIKYVGMYPPPDAQPVPEVHIVDGRRHKVWPDSFDFAYWDADKLIVEHWTDLTGGNLIGRTIWQLQSTSQKTEIIKTYLSMMDNSVLGSEVYTKTSWR